MNGIHKFFIGVQLELSDIDIHIDVHTNIHRYTDRTKYISGYLNTDTNIYGKLFVYTSDEIYSYNGMLINGKKCNNGKIVYQISDKDYELYEGNFLFDNFHGYGKLKFKNGNIYYGEFINAR
jgi:hypothetical protein